MTRQNEGLYQKLRLVDDTELQRLIEKRLRDYNPTLTKRANLQLEMLGALERRDLPAEERLALYNAAKQGFDTLTAAKENAIGEGHNIDLPIIPVPPHGHGPPIPVNQHHSNDMGQFVLPPRVEDRPNVETDAAPLTPKRRNKTTKNLKQILCLKLQPLPRICL